MEQPPHHTEQGYAPRKIAQSEALQYKDETSVINRKYKYKRFYILLTATGNIKPRIIYMIFEVIMATLPPY